VQHVPTTRQYAQHSPYSSPGRFAALIRALPDQVEALCAASRNVIGHYRDELRDLPVSRRPEIDSRWLEEILAVDQSRHGTSLDLPRAASERVAGCCRDHSLFVVGALRERGVPARNRVGFASYFTADYHHDHVVVEYHNGQRWIRMDPELAGEVHAGANWRFNPRDLPVGAGAPFETAAEAWRGYRLGRHDASSYGVLPGSDFAGPDLVRSYVIFEVAHRFGAELLLWDSWGTDPVTDDEIDEVAELLVRADQGDQWAEDELAARYNQDSRLRPGDVVTQHSPYGNPPQQVSLRRS
jgi:hypothetical protein